MIHWLERTVAAPREMAPISVNKEAMQKVTLQAAFEPDSWTPERAGKVAALFDGLAAGWNERQALLNRYDPLVDALARGDVGAGRCLEVGSGTGLATPTLDAHFTAVISVDLSMEMLRLAGGRRVLGDANMTPFADATFDCAVFVNAILFPRETARVLAPGATLVWVNTIGADTPIHLPPEDVAAAMGDGWHGVAAEAGLGLWTVLRHTSIG